MFTDPLEDYARGFVPFLGAIVFLDSKPLIPRVETEYWVERAIAEIPTGRDILVLDLFAGSGAIGIATLKYRPRSRVLFGDINATHFPTILKSLGANGIDPVRAMFKKTDVWSHVSEIYDFILANPPYVSRERKTVEASVVNTEPEEALLAPDDGFFYIEKFIQGLSDHLTPSGVAYVEHEPFHTERISGTATQNGFATDHKRDQYDQLRVTRLSHDER